MKVRFCGVRGSTPASGVEFDRVGGSTSCVAITPDRSDRPSLLLDAGTGIRNVTPLLRGDPFRGTILLSHLHWDHVQGLPFFGAGDREGSRVTLVMPDQGTDAAEVLRQTMSPPHFPIGPEGLHGNWSFRSLAEGAHVVEGFPVRARELPHKGGRTYGYRIEDASTSVAYLPDHRPAPRGSDRRAAIDLCLGVDLLIHDAQFLDSEDAVAEDYGHSTLSQAIELAEEAQVAELVLFHHGPGRTDTALDDIVNGVRTDGLVVSLAVEGVERTSGGRVGARDSVREEADLPVVGSTSN
jgi:phosphoribosyl 1,2-cyclic phosphodiesterase